MKPSDAIQVSKYEKRLMRGQRSNKFNPNNKHTLPNDCKCSQDFSFYPVK